MLALDSSDPLSIGSGELILIKYCDCMCSGHTEDLIKKWMGFLLSGGTVLYILRFSKFREPSL